MQQLGHRKDLIMARSQQLQEENQQLELPTLADKLAALEAGCEDLELTLKHKQENLAQQTLVLKEEEQVCQNTRQQEEEEEQKFHELRIRLASLEAQQLSIFSAGLAWLLGNMLTIIILYFSNKIIE